MHCSQHTHWYPINNLCKICSSLWREYRLELGGWIQLGCIELPCSRDHKSPTSLEMYSLYAGCSKSRFCKPTDHFCSSPHYPHANSCQSKLALWNKYAPRPLQGVFWTLDTPVTLLASRGTWHRSSLPWERQGLDQHSLQHQILVCNRGKLSSAPSLWVPAHRGHRRVCGEAAQLSPGLFLPGQGQKACRFFAGPVLGFFVLLFFFFLLLF